ncbi:hypothetical protein ABW21_db0201841 [Orbilia brochopaga]|nr:hypothetical protein ABW21_db0201841 [Drechslerella brochopaga]
MHTYPPLQKISANAFQILSHYPIRPLQPICYLYSLLYLKLTPSIYQFDTVKKMSANNITPPDGTPVSKRPELEQSSNTERDDSTSSAKAQDAGGKRQTNDTRDDKVAST